MIYYIFLDGVGFGEDSPEKNPFSKFAKGFFLPLAGKKIPDSSIYSKAHYVRTDANMGLKGLPQSATGQTSLWTGINAVEVIGRHVSGVPSFTLKKIIAKHSIMKILKEHGYSSAFLNCYSDVFFSRMEENRRLISASTLIQMAADIPFRTFEDLRKGNGLFMDITHDILQEFGKKFLPPDDELFQKRDPFEMGKRSVVLARNQDLTMFEYFLTDKTGHSQNWEHAEYIINTVEKFMDGVMSELNPKTEHLIVTSDHGNLEDLSDKVHTSNPVPTFLYGKYADSMKDKIHTLADIVPAIYSELKIPEKPVYVKQEG